LGGGFDKRAYAASSHRRNRVWWTRCSSFACPRVDARYTRAQPQSAIAKLATNMGGKLRFLIHPLKAPAGDLPLSRRKFPDENRQFRREVAGDSQFNA
jgi:hypothetical protein